MKIGYARISTKSQNFDLQIDALKKSGCEKIYKDIISGSLSNRPALDKLLEGTIWVKLPMLYSRKSIQPSLHKQWFLGGCN